MTTKAIEAGARAICQSQHGHTNWFETGEGAYAFRARAKACIEAAIASGELVSASAVAAERERCAQHIEQRAGSIPERQEIATELRALESANGEYVSGWRTMDSAPKDMTEIIVLCGPKDVRLGWCFAPSSTTFGWFDQRQKPIDPTRWMPMPAPLNAASSNGSGK